MSELKTNPMENMPEKPFPPTNSAEKDEVKQRMDEYEQTEEPVKPPAGFNSPVFKIGARVTIHPFPDSWNKSLGLVEGMTGTICRIIFCKSDGRTILYGVKTDDGKGGRMHAYEVPEM